MDDAPARTHRPADAATLHRATDLAVAFLETLPDRPVARPADLAALRERFGGPLPETGVPPLEVIEELAEIADDGLVATAGPRYHGFVIGGSVPAALAADWLTSTWDQNAAMYVMGPAAAVAEEVAGRWLLELLGLPPTASVGFTTGATMATFTGLAAGRHALLARAGWDVERDGLPGAPPLPVVVGAEAHATVHAALQLLGLGSERVHRVTADDQGRMRPDELDATLRTLDHPALVCAQAGNVNTGAFDPLPEVTDVIRAHGGWLHIDGAFGMWAATDPTRRHHVKGIERADSWTVDSHKWLNVPYDSGLAFVADPAAHRAAMVHGAAYYVQASGGERDGYAYVPESSRRARGFTVWAAIRSLGRAGIADMVARTCGGAVAFAERLGTEPWTRILNDVVLNQVLVRFDDPSDDPALGDRRTDAVIAAVQRGGTLWLGGTTWHGMRAMRISVSGWATTIDDIERSSAAIADAARSIPMGPPVDATATNGR